MSRDDHAVQLIDHGDQMKTEHLLQCSQRCHGVEFRHVSISTRQRSLRCGQNLRGPFLRAALRSSDGGQWGDKRAHNFTTKVSFCTIIIRLCHGMVAITRV